MIQNFTRATPEYDSWDVKAEKKMHFVFHESGNLLSERVLLEFGPPKVGGLVGRSSC